MDTHVMRSLVSRRWARFAIMLAWVAAGLGAAAQAGTAAYEVPAGTVGNQAFGGPLGMDFNVNHTIVVTDLGVFDDGSNGLNLNLGAGLWDRTSTAAPLESLSFTGGDPGTLVAGSRFKPLATPRMLLPGLQGTIVAEGYGAGESLANSHGRPPVWATDDGGGSVSFVGGGRYGTVPGTYPGTGDGGPANRYAAGSLVFEPVNIAYEVFGGAVGDQAFGGSLGMDFLTRRPMEITHLGVFDSGQDGLSGTISARLYDRANTSTALATLTFTGSDGTLIGGSRFLPLTTPLSLPAGFEGTIVADGYGGAEPNGNSGAGAWQTSSGQGALLFVGSSRWGNAGQFPTNIDGGPVDRYAAGTFMFDSPMLPPKVSGPVDVPNPSFELPGRPQQPAGGHYGNDTIGWNPSGGTNAGDFNPAADIFTDPLPDGSHVAFINSGALNSDPLGETLQANTLYILDVDWGQRTDGPAVDPQFSMSLRAGGTTLGWINNTNMQSGPTPGPGQFEPARGYFTASHNAAIGSALDISLSGGTTKQAVFDNVRLWRLTGAAIPLVNPSFEADDVNPNGGWQEGATGWVASGTGGGLFEEIGQITPADGFQSAFIRGGGSLTQTLAGVPLEPGFRYILLADVADRIATPFAGYQVELLAGGQQVAIDDDSLGVIPDAGYFYVTSVIDVSIPWDHALAGQDLGVRLTALGGGGNQTYFDNVRLFALEIPEPATLALVGFGIAGLGGYIRRRRRQA